MILHIDIDCFYCSAERLRDDSLRNIPIAVGGQGGVKIFGETPKESDFGHGIIVTSSYEARSKGVKTGMLIKHALSVCPDLVIIPPQHRYYRELSRRLHQALMRFSPVVESLSIDEFFCDLKGLDIDLSLYTKKVKDEILEKIGLPVSIGVAPSKWIAKLATGAAKPSGIRIVLPSEVPSFISHQPLNAFSGMGKQMRLKLKAHGIHTLGEAANAKHLFDSWGKGALKLYERLVGEDEEPVLANKPRKSIGISRTFPPLKNRQELRRRVLILARHVSALVLKHESYPRSFSFSLRYEYGTKITQQVTKDR
ncbi:MAG: DNA polymerase IV, partial [Campylobacteraceae bacterium]|nr:DNA polymerase IV [Campylobacteraceae bacterium]